MDSYIEFKANTRMHLDGVYVNMDVPILTGICSSPVYIDDHGQLDERPCKRKIKLMYNHVTPRITPWDNVQPLGCSPFHPATIIAEAVCPRSLVHAEKVLGYLRIEVRKLDGSKPGDIWEVCLLQHWKRRIS